MTHIQLYLGVGVGGGIALYSTLLFLARVDVNECGYVCGSAGPISGLAPYSYSIRSLSLTRASQFGVNP